MTLSQGSKQQSTRAKVGLWLLVLLGVADGESFLAFTNVKNPRSNLAFSPDGAYLATAAADGTVQIWPLPAVRR